MGGVHSTPPLPGHAGDVVLPAGGQGREGEGRAEAMGVGPGMAAAPGLCRWAAGALSGHGDIWGSKLSFGAFCFLLFALFLSFYLLFDFFYFYKRFEGTYWKHRFSVWPGFLFSGFLFDHTSAT